MMLDFFHSTLASLDPDVAKLIDYEANGKHASNSNSVRKSGTGGRARGPGSVFQKSMPKAIRTRMHACPGSHPGL